MLKRLGLVGVALDWRHALERRVEAQPLHRHPVDDQLRARRQLRRLPVELLGEAEQHLDVVHAPVAHRHAQRRDERHHLAPVVREALGRERLSQRGDEHAQVAHGDKVRAPRVPGRPLECKVLDHVASDRQLRLLSHVFERLHQHGHEDREEHVRHRDHVERPESQRPPRLPAVELPRLGEVAVVPHQIAPVLTGDGGEESERRAREGLEVGLAVDAAVRARLGCLAEQIYADHGERKDREPKEQRHVGELRQREVERRDDLAQRREPLRQPQHAHDADRPERAERARGDEAEPATQDDEELGHAHDADEEVEAVPRRLEVALAEGGELDGGLEHEHGREDD
mmetsp:Transcript_882/g.2315  ORF Transcript_882/g.2315 Transcript_882/m.2315 type:complete len:342 (-) Transcript_882:2515-3540(-)